MSTDLATATNHQIRLAARPVGLPKDSDWSVTEEPVSLPAEGGVLVRAGHTEASVDISRQAGLNPSAVICVRASQIPSHSSFPFSLSRCSPSHSEPLALVRK